MASAGLFSAIPQAEAVAQDATRAIEKFESRASSGAPSGDSTIDSASALDKAHADQEVTNLARQFTQHSIKTVDGSYHNPFNGSDIPALDPLSGKFRPDVWTKTLIGLGLHWYLE